MTKRGELAQTLGYSPRDPQQLAINLRNNPLGTPLRKEAFSLRTHCQKCTSGNPAHVHNGGTGHTALLHGCTGWWDTPTKQGIGRHI